VKRGRDSPSIQPESAAETSHAVEETVLWNGFAIKRRRGTPSVCRSALYVRNDNRFAAL